LIDLIDDNPVYLEIMQARYEFYYKMHERMLQEANGLIDFMHVGEDLGNQITQMISFDIFDRHFAPKYSQYFDMVHSYGARTMMHICGTVWMFLPRLIEMGLDVYDVVQPTTPENDIASLAKNFGSQIIFQGSMDVQREIAWGSVEDVVREAKRRLDLFPKGGLILGPSHAIQVGSPVENAVALYRTAGSLMDDIASWVYEIEGEEQTEMNMSKLF
jgi:uroporphyrinogen decarboxylase